MRLPGRPGPQLGAVQRGRGGLLRAGGGHHRRVQLRPRLRAARARAARVRRQRHLGSSGDPLLRSVISTLAVLGNDQRPLIDLILPSFPNPIHSPYSGSTERLIKQ